jgi:hypothetical protein
MFRHLTSYDWFLIGKFGAIGIVALSGWLARQRWLPHRHDGYVSVSGYVHACGRCGKLPPGAYRAGFHGMEPGVPQEYQDAIAAHNLRVLAGREVPSPDWLDKATAIQDAYRAGYELSSSNQSEDDDWVPCPSCGRPDVAVHTMRDGECIRCWLIHHDGQEAS